jgi:dTDP-4-dehydrorhamnose reductase
MTSRLEVAQAIVEEVGLADDVAVRPVGSEYFAETYFAPRPDCERLINRKLGLRGLDVMRPWREALAEYLRTDYSGYLRGIESASSAGD